LFNAPAKPKIAKEKVQEEKMKKLIAIISGVSIAALVGGVSLADEKEAAEEANTVAVKGDEIDEELRTRAKGVKDRGEEEEGEQGYTRVIQQQGRVLLDSDWNEGDGDEAQSPDLTHTRAIGDEGKTIGHVDHGKTTVDRAVDDNEDDSQEKKKDDDG
jgi:hypothetical protein